MGFFIAYKKFFELKIKHDYLLNKGDELYDDLSEEMKTKIMESYDIHKYLDVEPTKATLNKMNNHNLVYKKTKEGIIVGIKVEEVKQGEESVFTPFVSLGSLLSLSFMVSVKDDTFFNFSNFPQESHKGGNVYYFTNRNETGWDYPSLSSPVPTFNKENTYYPGQLVFNKNRDRMYEAVTGLKTGSDLKKKGQWKEVKNPKRYFHPEDTVLLARDYFVYPILDDGVTEAEIILERLGDKTVLSQTVSNNGNALDKVEIPLQQYIAGKYEFTINYIGLEQPEKIRFYWEAGLAQQKPFALVEIAQNEGFQNEEYQLLVPGTMDHPDIPGRKIKVVRDEDELRVYEINIKNRSTFWLYTFSEPQEEASLADFYAVENSNNTKFVYNKGDYKIQPLTRFPIEIKKTDDSLMPNPNANKIYPRNNIPPNPPNPSNELKIYSEIFL